MKKIISFIMILLIAAGIAGAIYLSQETKKDQSAESSSAAVETNPPSNINQTASWNLEGVFLQNFLNMYNAHVLIDLQSEDEYIYKMWFFGWTVEDCNPDYPGCDAMFFGRSKDRINWEIYSGKTESGIPLFDTTMNPNLWEPVIIAGNTYFDQWHTGDPSVIKIGNVYYMAYSTSGFDADGIQEGGENDSDKDYYAIMGAVSEDGITWQKSIEPILDYTGELGSVEPTANGNYSRPSILYENGKFKMWFDYLNPSKQDVSMGYAELEGSASAEFFLNGTWSEIRSGSNPALTPMANPDIIHIGEKYYAYGDPGNYGNSWDWTSRKITEAISSDGVNWEFTGYIDPEVGCAATGVPEAYFSDGKIFITYGCQRGGDPYDFRYFQIKIMSKQIVSTGNVQCISQDSNNDGKISLVDLSNLLSKYNTTCEISDSEYGACGGQDSNKDGKISLVDLSNLLSKYNTSCGQLSCKEIRYSFSAFTPSDFSENSTVEFGGQSFTYKAFPWLKNTAYSYPEGTRRHGGYTISSKDCGKTWIRENEYVPPLMLSGLPETFQNGVNHFVTNLDANFFSQGFVTNYKWLDSSDNSITSKIYPVFANGIISKWSYQAMENNQEVLPVIGSANINNKDNLYSPTIVVNDDATKSIKLYFGGWRYTVSGDIPECNVKDRTALQNDPINNDGFKEEVCKCKEYKLNGWNIDSCTGDKIFVATNEFAGDNKLIYKVWKGNNLWTESGGDTPDFKPVISPAMLNNGGCSKTDCPYPFIHTNDPTVIKTTSTEYPYIMYFTGGVYDSSVNMMVNYTHVATSKDGIKWENFKILGKSSGANFPGGLSVNSANGTARAYFDSYRNKIVLLSVPLPTESGSDHPAITFNHPDVWKLFIYEIDISDPYTVISSQKVNSINHDLAKCEVGKVCAIAENY